MDGTERPGDPDEDPHGGAPIETAGAPPAAASAAVVLLHGRGSTASHMLTLIDEFLHHGVMYLAPQASHRSWFPRAVDAPIEANEPWVSSACDLVGRAMGVAGDAGIPPDRIVLVGFSQGGSIAGEFVARRPRRYGGLVVLAGSLLGDVVIDDEDGSIGDEDGSIGDEARSIDGTPVFLGCSASDPYVDADRVRDSARAFEALDGDVTCRLYDDLGHEINDDEIHAIDAMVGSVAGT